MRRRRVGRVLRVVEGGAVGGVGRGLPRVRLLRVGLVWVELVRVVHRLLGDMVGCGLYVGRVGRGLRRRELGGLHIRRGLGGVGIRRGLGVGVVRCGLGVGVGRRVVHLLWHLLWLVGRCLRLGEDNHLLRVERHEHDLTNTRLLCGILRPPLPRGGIVASELVLVVSGGPAVGRGGGPRRGQQLPPSLGEQVAAGQHVIDVDGRSRYALKRAEQHNGPNL
mmetsp:Transcript_9574/g.21647  ORF Transcript_9574/g.21647 Transcript_9574/m.21647 type:complete len:221 (-) Transcript_9574:138-800(-)